MIRIILGAIAGGAIGGLIGYAGKCNGGSCPFMCTPIGGIVTGVIIGALLASSILPRTSAPQVPPSEHVQHAESIDELQSIMQSNRVVLIDFYADWCGPCRQLAGTINEIADSYAGKAVVVKVNVDKSRPLAKQYAIRSIPDVRIFAEGKQVQSFVGVQAKDAYIKVLDEQIQ